MTLLKNIFILIFSAAIFSTALRAQVIELQSIQPEVSKADESVKNVAVSDKVNTAKNDISYADAFVLGIVEGVTEYLPVSSTGHLILANAFLKLDGQQPLLDKAGNKVLDSKSRPYTMKMAADAYAIVIQFGAILAVGIIYWQYMLKMLFGLIGRNPEGFRLLRNLVIAFLPAAVIGFLFHDFIEEYLFGVKPVIFALAAGAALMIFVQKKYSELNKYRKDYPKLEDMTIKQSLCVGFLQCVAMWPGTSRSMMTILGGYIVGLRPSDSAKFSFLLGFMTLSAASIYKTYKDGSAISATLSASPLALGLLVAFVSAAISVHWLIGFLTRKGLAPFAYYRLFIAAILAGLLYFNLI